MSPYNNDDVWDRKIRRGVRTRFLLLLSSTTTTQCTNQVDAIKKGGNLDSISVFPRPVRSLSLSLFPLLACLYTAATMDDITTILFLSLFLSLNKFVAVVPYFIYR